MVVLSKPSRVLAEKILSRVSVLDRLTGFCMEPTAGFEFDVFRLEDANRYLKMNIGLPVELIPYWDIEIIDLIEWIENKLNDKELSDALRNKHKEFNSCQQSVAKNMNKTELYSSVSQLINQRLEQCKQILNN